MEKNIFSGKIKLNPKLIEEIKNAGGKLTLDIRNIMEMDKQLNDLLTIRGRVVEKSIEIEEQLNFLTSSLLFKNQINKLGEAKFFEDFIMNTTHLAFSSKLKIFRSLYKICSFLKEREEISKSLATQIQKIIEIRDNFAHGDICFKDVKPPLTPYLFYYRENEPKEQQLDNNYFDSLNLLYKKTFEKLDILRSHINKSFEEGKELKWDII
ncbi:MAG: hypothetical protein WA139_02165 [Candidatus Aenigmatarchaeota archaeon]